MSLRHAAVVISLDASTVGVLSAARVKIVSVGARLLRAPLQWDPWPPIFSALVPSHLAVSTLCGRCRCSLSLRAFGNCDRSSARAGFNGARFDADGDRLNALPRELDCCGPEQTPSLSEGVAPLLSPLAPPAPSPARVFFETPERGCSRRSVDQGMSLRHAAVVISLDASTVGVLSAAKSQNRIRGGSAASFTAAMGPLAADLQCSRPVSLGGLDAVRPLPLLPSSLRAFGNCDRSSARAGFNGLGSTLTATG